MAKRSARSRRGGWLTAGLLGVIPWVVPAQQVEAPPITEMAPIEVEGERVHGKPAWVSSTMRQSLDDLQVRDWSDFGNRLEPSVSYNRQNRSINIRGLEADHVLARVDGIRLPWLNDGTRGVKGGLQSIDFSSLSQIDIVRGADATLGGSGVLGGMAQLRTLEPTDLLHGAARFGALIKADYDAADVSKGVNAALAGQVHDHTYWLLQAGMRGGHALDNGADVGGYGPKRSLPNPEDYRQSNLLLKLQQRWGGEHKLGLTGEFFRRRDDIDNKDQQGPGSAYAYGENSTTQKTKRERVSLDYAYIDGGNGQVGLNSARAMLYWQRVRLTDAMESWRTRDARAAIIPNDPFRYGFPTGLYDRHNAIEETLVGLNAEGTKRINGPVVQVWTLGGEWYGNRTRQYSGGHDNCPSSPARLPAPFGPRPCDLLHTNQADMPQVQGNQWALWAQNEMLFREGRYALAPSLRYDHYQQQPQQSSSYAANPNANGLPPTASGGRFSPSLLGTWRAQEQLTLYAQYGYSFKAPSATQLYMNYGGVGSYLRLGNPYLRPETSKGWELGAKVGSDELGGTVSFFDNRYQNFIDNKVLLGPDSPLWQPAWAAQYPLGVYATLNRAQIRIYGAEASAHWKLAPSWRAWGSLAWAVGKDESRGQYLNTVAPLKAVLGLGYDRPRWGVSALLTAAVRRDKVEYPAATATAPYADFRAPGYETVDLITYWLPASIKGLRVQAGVFNLFNKKYWEAINVPTAGSSALPRAVDWYTEPGRSVRVTLTYQF